VVSQCPIASREIDDNPQPPLPLSRPIPRTHYLGVVLELNEPETKKKGFTVVRRRWYLTIDGTSRNWIPENEARYWLLAKPTSTRSSVTIIDQRECDLIRTINW
jgi:hypothetical protein